MPCTSGVTGALKPTNGPTSRGRQASKQASKQTNKQAHLVPSRCFTLQFSFADSDTNARLYCSLCRILQQWPPTLHQVQTGSKWRISFEGLRKGYLSWLKRFKLQTYVKQEGWNGLKAALSLASISGHKSARHLYSSWLEALPSRFRQVM